MEPQKCKRCNTALPDQNPKCESLGLVENVDLWDANARKWCVSCQQAFLDTMRDSNDALRYAIETQDGTPEEIARHGHFVSGMSRYGSRKMRRRDE